MDQGRILTGEAKQNYVFKQSKRRNSFTSPCQRADV